MTEALPGEDNTSDSLVEKEGKESSSSIECQYKECIIGEEAMRISPNEPYSLRRPIRRGHLNISQHYSLQQVPSLNFAAEFLQSCRCQQIEPGIGHF